MSTEGSDTPPTDLFAASRELIADDEARDARQQAHQAQRSAEAGRAALGAGPIIGRTWPMPRQYSRLIGLAGGVAIALLVAADHRGWTWALFSAAVIVALALGVRVMQSKVVLDAQSVRVQGAFKTTTWPADQIRDMEVADVTPPTVQSRYGPIPRVQSCRLILTNGRRVSLSTAGASIGTALANRKDSELSALRDVLEAWLAQARGAGTS